MRTSSAVMQTVNLKSGQTYSRSLYIPYERADPDIIRDARRTLMGYLTPVVARARKRKDRNYKVHTVATFTTTYDVIVTGIVCIEPRRIDDV